jgi:hypothetical protein
MAAMAGSASAPAPMLRRWSAWLPIAIALFFFGLIWRHLALAGPTRETDEGIEARLFQLLMPVQFIVIAYFAATSVARAPRTALVVLAVQVGLTLALFATIYWLEHFTPLA